MFFIFRRKREPHLLYYLQSSQLPLQFWDRLSHDAIVSHQDRSSHQRCSVKKGVLRNFAKFTGKHLCQRLFFNKVAGDSSSKHPITWCFIAFVVAPEIERTETTAFILWFNLQPSTFLVIESFRIKVFFITPFFNFGFSFSFFFFIFLYFFFALSWLYDAHFLLKFKVFLPFRYLSKICSYLDFHFTKILAQQLVSVRDFINSVLIILYFLR